MGTPALVKAYNEHLKAKGCEIVFVSSDRSADAFKEYYETMPWLAIPHGDKRKELLSSRFGVSGIPSFVLVDGETGETITTGARSNVGADPEGVEFPWHPKPVVDLVVGDIGPLNEETCLCVLMEQCDTAAVQPVIDVLTPIAEATKAAGDSTCFFYASSVGGPTEQIRKLAKLGEPSRACRRCCCSTSPTMAPTTQATRSRSRPRRSPPFSRPTRRKASSASSSHSGPAVAANADLRSA